MLKRLGSHAVRWTESPPWTNVYGAARSLLALATGLTLALNSSGVLFQPTVDQPAPPHCSGASAIGLFCVFPASHLEVARWVGVILLIVVMSGWRPRITGPVHWWLSFSAAFSMTIPDGGDQITAVLTLLLIPVALTDPRRWHWQTAQTTSDHRRARGTRLIALSAMIVIRLQVAGIYLHAAVAKFGVDEWADGTAMYYWLSDPTFGAPDLVREPLLNALDSGWVVGIFTWGAILIELALFMGLVVPSRHWRILLVTGLAFHAAIALLMGLASFSVTMSAALILYLRPWQQPFHLSPWLLRGIRGRNHPSEPEATPLSVA